MYLLKSAYTDQTATISKFLKEDWEPFAVLQVKVKDGPKLRMYFRKFDSEPVTDVMHSAAAQVKLDGDEFAETFNKIMTDWANSFFERLDKTMVFKSAQHIYRLGDPYPNAEEVVGLSEEEDSEDKEASDEDFEILELINNNTTTVLYEIAMRDTDKQSADLLSMDKRELATLIIQAWKNKIPDEINSDETDKVEKVTSQDLDVPGGDGFRVVDEIPTDLTSLNNRTPHQDAAIEKLKKDHGNVSVLPGGNGGEVRVMAGADIYTIKTNGNFTREPTGANTSALG